MELITTQKLAQNATRRAGNESVRAFQLKAKRGKTKTPAKTIQTKRKLTFPWQIIKPRDKTNVTQNLPFTYKESIKLQNSMENHRNGNGNENVRETESGES